MTIFLVPGGARGEEFETAMRQRLSAAAVDVADSSHRPARIETDDTEELPLWTWFLALPRPAVLKLKLVLDPLE